MSTSTPEVEPAAKKPRDDTDDVHYLQGQQKVYSEAEVCTATSTGLSSWETGEEAAEHVPSPGCVHVTEPLAVQQGHLPKDVKLQCTSVKKLSLSLKRVTPRASLTGVRSTDHDNDKDRIGKGIRKNVTSEYRGRPEESMESSVGVGEESEVAAEKEERKEQVLTEDFGHVTGPLVVVKHGRFLPKDEKLQRATVKRLSLSLKKVTPKASFVPDVRSSAPKEDRNVEDQIGKDNRSQCSGRPEASMESSVSIGEGTGKATKNIRSEFRCREDGSMETSVGISEANKKATKNVSSEYRDETDCEAANIDDREGTSNVVGSCGLRGEVGVEGMEKGISSSDQSMGSAVGTSEKNENVAREENENNATMSSSATEGELDEKLENENAATALPVEVSPTVGHTGKSEAYYSANFKSAINSVITSSPERHVISGEAVEIVDSFMALPEPQQQLYVRLFLRKHHWIRASKLSYKDIAADLHHVIDGLVAMMFLTNEQQLTDPAEVLNLLQLHELRTLCKSVNLPPSVVGNQKTRIVESLFRHCRQHRPLFGGKSSFLETVVTKAKSVLGTCVRVTEAPVEVFSRLLLLFSLTHWTQREEDNGFSQIIYRMLQVNIGRLVYPEYEIHVTRPIFSSQEDFERFYSAMREEQQLVSLVEEKDVTAVDMLLARARPKFEAECQLVPGSHGALNPDSSPAKQDSEDVISTAESLPFLRRFSTGWVYARMLSITVEYLEKQRRYKEAIDLLECLLSQEFYCTSSRGRWWERMALNLDCHIRQKEKCLEVMKSALSDPHLRPARRLSLLQRAHKLCQSGDRPGSNKRGAIQKGRSSRKTAALKQRYSSTFTLEDFPMMDLITAPEVCIIGKRPNNLGPLFAASVTDSPDSCTLVRVEGFAMYHYSNVEGWPCAVHAESSSFTAMFALLMWDVIFTPGVPDVFRTPYQAGPLDLYSGCFYTSRREMIEAKLSWIRGAQGKDISSVIETTWISNYGKVCAGMDWELFPTADDAKSLAVCMGGNLLSLVCQELSRNYGHCTGGLPDLTLWNPSNTTCKFVEVKGPGDRLSHKQVVWLSRLAEWGCNVEVCRVRANS